MEQFSLEKYLENPSRKVATREGRPVRIVCTDRKAKSGNIVGLVGEDESFIYVWQNDGTHAVSGIDANDLFFADEEELTEFEKKLVDLVSGWCDSHIETPEEYINKHSQTLLDLARKEIKGILTTDAYNQGREDALKDLPKWRRSDDNLPYPYIGGLGQKFLVKNGYYIKISDLETLPKEE